MGSAGVVEVHLGYRRGAVERLVWRAVQHQVGDGDVLAGHDPQRLDRHSLVEVVRQAFNQLGAPVAFDPVGHPEGDVGG